MPSGRLMVRLGAETTIGWPLTTRPAICEEPLTEGLPPVHLASAWDCTALAVEGGRLIARPRVVPAEDAWAYTPEHMARVANARAQATAGQVFQLTEDELRARIGLPPADQDVGTDGADAD